MTDSPPCRQCGTALSDSTLGGLCLSCTARISFRFAVDSPDSAEGAPQPARDGDGADFGDYVLLEEVARGGMGVVYRARQKSLKRLVAIKMILGGRFAGPEQVTRFHREAEAAAALRHPNIISIHEVGEIDGQHFFSMDFVEGRNLAERVKKQPFPHEEAAALVQTLAEAVQYAHRQGVIHRDLKPSNVILDRDGIPHITDFGLAKRLDTADADGLPAQLTLSGQALGSPAFAAPEQAGGPARDTTPAIDVYALGAVLYNLLTGRPPFVADSLEHTLHLVLSAPPPSPRVLIPTLPRDLDTITLKCLAKDPARRYATAQELADDLARFLRGETIRARPATPLEKLASWAARNRLLAALATLSLLLLVAGFSGILWQWRRAEIHAESEAGQRARAESALNELQLQHAELRLQGGATSEGLAFLAEVLRADPGNRVAAERLLSVLSHRSFSLPLGPPLFHEAAVTHVELSPDGAMIASASEDGTARVWNAGDGTALSPPLRHEDAVLTAHFSPDGAQLVTATEAGAARLWNSRTGEPLTPVLAHESAVLFAQLHPHEALLLTGTRDGKARLWDLSTGKSRFDSAFEHRGELTAARFSPDGSRILTVGRFDGTLQIFRTETGKRHSRAKLGNERLEAADFSPDGSMIAAAAYDRHARVWDLESGKALPLIPLQNTCMHLAFSPDSRLLATASRARRVAVWNLQSGELVREFPGHHTWVQQVEFSPDGLHLLTREYGSRAHVWDLLTGQPVVEPLQFSATLRSVHFGPAGSRVVTGTGAGWAQAWDVRPGAALPLDLHHAQHIRAADTSADGKRLVIATRGGVVAVWDTTNGESVASERFPAHAKAALSPDGQAVLVGLADGTVVIWDLESGRRHEDRHSPRIMHVEFSPDGSRGLAAGFHGTARVWDIASGQPIGPPLRHQARLWHASFSPDGQRVVTCTDDWRDPKGHNAARVWDPVKGTALSPPLRHLGGLHTAVFSPDGARILTSSYDHTAAIWDLQSGRRLATMRHESVVRTARFDATGERVVSASWDNTARVWDAATGRPLTTPMRHDSEVYCAEFSPDGTRVVTGTAAGVVRIWDAATGNPLSDPLRHDGGIVRAQFTPDGRLLVASARQARVWELPALDARVPDWLPDLAQTLAATRVEAGGLARYSPAGHWSTLRQRMAADSNSWAEWFLDDRAARDVAERVAVPGPVARDRLATIDSLEGAREAVRLAPAEATAWQRLAAAIDDSSDPGQENLAEYASRKSVLLSPEKQELWTARLDRLQAREDDAYLAAVEEALAHHADNLDFRIRLAREFRAQDRFEEGAASYRAVIESGLKDDGRRLAEAIDGQRDCLVAVGEPDRAQQSWLEAKGVPARPPSCPPECVDLSAHYNATLDEPWHNRNWQGNDLATLLAAPPRCDVPFDLRGVVQLDSTKLREVEAGFPEEARDIAIGRRASALHFLHGAAWGFSPPEGTRIGAYRLRYADGESVEIPLVTKRNIDEWHIEDWPNEDLPEAQLIELGQNQGGARIRLYKVLWRNPHPDREIASLDFESEMTVAAPFLVALTAEP